MATKLTGASCNYSLGATLGVGEYGKAIQCTRDDDGTHVVVKQVHIAALSTEEQAEAINEVRVMQELDHLNIVKYIECMQQQGYLYIVMEYCCYGELSGLIANRAKAQRPFTEQEIMFWFVQIALGLWHVHSKNILHRDLKTQNIFISKGGILKLGDFGISRVLNSDTELAKTAIGTPYYLSPEICQDMPYNRKSDVWALGCVLYELCTLKRAFTGGSLPALVVKILKGQYPPLPSKYSSSLKALVDSLLQQDPRVRPSIDAVLRLEYVKGHLARYAQHVVRLTTGQPGQAPTPRGVSAAAAELAEGSAGGAAPITAAVAKQPDTGVTAAPAAVPTKDLEEPATKAEAPKAAASSGLRVPLPGFLRKKQPQQQQQQLPPVPPTAATQQNQEQSSSFRSRIARSLSGSGGSSSGGGIKGFLRRSNSGSGGSKKQGRQSAADSDMASSFNSSKCELSQAGSLSNSFNNSSTQANSTTASQIRAGREPVPDLEVSTVSAADAADDADDMSGSGYDSSSSPSPTGDSKGQQQRRQRKKLIGTGWIEQQQLALARLQADLAASPAVRGKPPAGQPQQEPSRAAESSPALAAPRSAAAAAAAAASPMQQLQTPAKELGPKGTGVTPSPQLPNRVAGAPGSRATPAPANHSSSKASVKKSSSKPNSGGGSRGGAAASPADLVAAARAARLAERASWQQQQAKAAAEDAVRRAARAAELAAALQDKAAAAHKAEEDGHAAVTAHRQHMKVIQPRIHKSQLAELGAAFRQRLEAQAGTGDPAVVGTGGCGLQIGDEGYQLLDALAVPFGVKILQKAPGGQAMLLDLSEAGMGPVTGAVPDTAASSGQGSVAGSKLQRSISAGRPASAASGAGVSGGPSSRLRGASSAKQLGGGASGAGRYSRSGSGKSTAASGALCKQSSQKATADKVQTPGVARVKSVGRAGSQQQQSTGKQPPAAASADKPWKSGRSAGTRRSVEPAVQIFAPYGSLTAADTKQQQQQQQSDVSQQASVQEITFAGQLNGASTVAKSLQALPSPLVVERSDQALQEMQDGDSQPTSPQVVNVLHTIQAALKTKSNGKGPGIGGKSASGSGSSNKPSADGGPAAAGNSAGARISEADSLELPPEAPTGGDQLPPTAVRGWGGVDELSGTAAVPVAQKIEALRLSLEQSLGVDSFMLAYRYMTAMHQSPAEGENEGEEPPYEVLLFELLGPEKVHFVHLIHKLLMLENQAFAQQQ